MDSVAYIQALLSECPGVLFLAEHWLWPYDLVKLNNVSDEYVGYGIAYSRFTEKGMGGKGCGGVGVLWHRSFGATPVTGISSDRICAICFRI